MTSRLVPDAGEDRAHPELGARIGVSVSAPTS